jgi:hypothetical protein
MVDERTRFCHRELARFAEESFVAAHGGWIHKVTPGHYDNGTPTKTLPGFPSVLGARVGPDKEQSKQGPDGATISAAWTNEYAHQQAIYIAYIQVTKRSVDHVQSLGAYVQKAATIIAIAYMAILAAVFALSFNMKDFRMPLQGMIPVLFLALAVLLATLYLSCITPCPPKQVVVGAPTLYEVQRLRLMTFMQWTLQNVLYWRSLLHMSLVSLSAGIVFLPAAYLAMGSPSNILMWIFAGAALVLVFALPLGVDWLLKSRNFNPAHLGTTSDEL